jgi:hypothetical protein
LIFPFHDFDSVLLGEDRSCYGRRAKARVEYGCFRRAEADKLFQTLPAEEQAAIEALARAKSSLEVRANGPLSQILLNLKRTQLTAERHPDKIATFDRWSTGRSLETNT